MTGHFMGASIAPDSATPSVVLGKMPTAGGIFGGIDFIPGVKDGCKALCTVAQGTVSGACSTVGGPIAVAACIAAAQVAGDACRNRC